MTIHERTGYLFSLRLLTAQLTNWHLITLLTFTFSPNNLTSGQSRNRHVSLDYSPFFLFFWTCLMEYFNAKVKSNGFKVCPSIVPFWTWYARDKFLSLWTSQQASLKQTLISLTVSNTDILNSKWILYNNSLLTETTNAFLSLQNYIINNVI